MAFATLPGARRPTLLSPMGRLANHRIKCQWQPAYENESGDLAKTLVTGVTRSNHEADRGEI